MSNLRCITLTSLLPFTASVMKSLWGSIKVNDQFFLLYAMNQNIRCRCYTRTEDTVLINSLPHKSRSWINVRTQALRFSSFHSRMVSMRSEKPICTPPCLSEVFPTSPLKRFQSSSD